MKTNFAKFARARAPRHATCTPSDWKIGVRGTLVTMIMRVGALLWAAGAAAACQSDLDCSLNGDCTAGKCDCDAACECIGHLAGSGGGVGV